MCLAELCSGGLEEKPHRYHRQSKDQPLAVAAVESGGQLEVDWKMLFSETRIAEALPFPVQPQGAESAQKRSKGNRNQKPHRSTNNTGISTYHIIISIVQRGRVGHGAVHDPSFRFILGPNEILNLTDPQERVSKV